MNDKAYRNYLLAILLTIYAFNYVDRWVLALLLQDIKTELSLSDTQLGFMSGIAFALIYSVMGIPIARWADRGNRIAIISLAAAISGVAVALCGAAASFTQLLLIRMCVAVGEAGCVPPAHSLIADHFDRAERPKAVSIYKLGGSISVLIGYFSAGWLSEIFGWRMAFVFLGLPGAALGALVWFSLKEPRLEKSATSLRVCSAVLARPQGDMLEPQPSFKEACTALWANVTFRHLLIASSVALFFGAGIGTWNATFFIRTYGLKASELGTWLALIGGLSGLISIYLGGVIATRYAANNEPLQLKAMAIATAVSGLVLTCQYLSPNHYLAFALVAVSALVGLAATGPLYAMIQSLVPDRMRAMSIAVLFLFSNLIGLGLGPLAAGALSDALRPWAGEESIRYALLSLCCGTLWGAWHMWRAGKTVAEDLNAAQRRPVQSVHPPPCAA
jgi:MFS transporter, Spinster family, sphingosine-1-phosphate transporter